MMAAQEIVELFCELVVVRLPIIEAQKYVLFSLHFLIEILGHFCFFFTSTKPSVRVSGTLSLIISMKVSKEYVNAKNS